MRNVRILSYILLGTLLGSGLAMAADEFDPSDYAGRVVVVDFWASWCVPCRNSFPWLNTMQARYADRGLVIVGVNLDNDPAAAAEFLARYPADFDIVYDDDRSLARRFDVIAMPSSYLLDGDGTVVARHLGFKVRQQDDYEQTIVAALEAAGH